VTSQNREWWGGRQDASPGAHQSGPGGSLTYEPFYGLTQKPFSLSADPRFLFKSGTHALAFDALLAGIRRREGLIVLTGEIGTGKTTLCRSVLQHLDRRTFAAFVPDPFVSREDLLKMLLVDFGAISISDLKRGRLMGASRLDLSYLLYDFLDSLVPLQAFAVLVIDEAQNLPFPLLEEIRILSDLERREKLLQIVLVGQPELRAGLKQTQMRQVEQRVSVRCELAALDFEGVAGYVNHRLAVASDGQHWVEFTPSSLEAIYHASSGVPRLINRICDRALQRAYVSGTHKIESGFVFDAVTDLGLSSTAAPAAEADSPNEAEAAPPIQPDVEQPIQFAERPNEPEPERPIAAEPERPIEQDTADPESAPNPRPAGAVPPPREEVATSLSALDAEVDLFGDGPASINRSSTVWQRWATVALAMFLAACAFGGSTWYLHAQSVSSEAVGAILPALPPRPRLNHAVTPRILVDATLLTPLDAGRPAAGGNATARSSYFIQVATLESRSRAERVVEELTRAEYRARMVEFNLGSSRTPLFQVIIDGYASAVEAQHDLQRVRELPGYSDARLLDRF
jgi:general secretion pathway protein A